MADAVPTKPTRISYARARRLLIASGLAILFLVAAAMYARRVDTAEVVATLLFIPIFVGFVFWNSRGGVTAALLAVLAYVAVRYPAIEKVGASELLGLILSRSLAFVAFGAIGGWANQQLQASLNKLEVYDQIDDYTGLFNARFLVQDTDLEMSRSKRYQTIFSVASVDFPVQPLEQLPRRRRASLRRELGTMLKEAIRSIDRPVHGFDGRRHHFAVVLPETGAEGARTFGERLADRISRDLQTRRVPVKREDLRLRTVTYPDDGEGLQAIRQEFAAIDRFEHPEPVK